MKRATIALAMLFFALASLASAKMPEGEIEITIGATPNLRSFAGFNNGLPYQQAYHSSWFTIFLGNYEFTKDGTDPRDYALEIVGHCHDASSTSRGFLTTLFVTTTLSSFDFFGPFSRDFNNQGADAKVVFNGQQTTLLTGEGCDLTFAYNKKDAFYYNPWASSLLLQHIATLVPPSVGGEYLVGASAAVKSMYYTTEAVPTVTDDNTGLNTKFRVRVVRIRGKNK
jgi:hypothetical protein